MLEVASRPACLVARMVAYFRSAYVPLREGLANAMDLSTCELEAVRAAFERVEAEHSQLNASVTMLIEPEADGWIENRSLGTGPQDEEPRRRGPCVAIEDVAVTKSRVSSRGTERWHEGVVTVCLRGRRRSCT